MDGRTTEAVRKALRALQAAKNGISAADLQTKAGWAVRPHSTSLKTLASRHGFRHKRLKIDGILHHKFVPKASRRGTA